MKHLDVCYLSGLICSFRGRLENVLKIFVLHLLRPKFALAPPLRGGLGKVNFFLGNFALTLPFAKTKYPFIFQGVTLNLANLALKFALEGQSSF